MFKKKKEIYHLTRPLIIKKKYYTPLFLNKFDGSACRSCSRYQMSKTIKCYSIIIIIIIIIIRVRLFSEPNKLRELREPISTNQIFLDIKFYYIIQKGIMVKILFYFIFDFIYEKRFFSYLNSRIFLNTCLKKHYVHMCFALCDNCIFRLCIGVLYLHMYL